MFFAQRSFTVSRSMNAVMQQSFHTVLARRGVAALAAAVAYL
jgi:hypothetical protein